MIALRQQSYQIVAATHVLRRQFEYLALPPLDASTRGVSSAGLENLLVVCFVCTALVTTRSGAADGVHKASVDFRRVWWISPACTQRGIGIAVAQNASAFDLNVGSASSPLGTPYGSRTSSGENHSALQPALLCKKRNKHSLSVGEDMLSVRMQQNMERHELASSTTQSL